MIPYDDLVVALAAWRARQGLPVAQAAGAAPRAAPPAPAPAARPAPPRAPTPVSQPVAAPVYDDAGEEAQYEVAGDDDYVVPLGGGEATAIGAVPPASGKRNDW